MLGFVVAGLAYARGPDLAWFFVGVGLIIAGAAGLMMIEVTSPDPKDAPAPPGASVSDRKRWDEGPLADPWDGHDLCEACHGRKLCPSCGGDGGCEACAGRCWCSVCGGAGQWPRAPSRSIYSPAPADKRLAS